MQKIDSNRRVSSMSFAGWLFADVLIVLFVVFIGSEVRHSRAEIDASSPGETQQFDKLGVLETVPVEFTLNGVDQQGINSRSSKAAQELKLLIENDPLFQKLSNTNRYSPVTLVFSHFKNPDINFGTITSQRACELRTSLSKSIFDDATACRTFVDGKFNYGQVRFEIFLVAK